MTISQHPKIQVRPLCPADYQDWLVLWQGYQIFYKSNIPDDVSQVSYSRMLDPKEPTFGALATDGQNALGLVHWIFHRSNWTTGDYCYLQDLYVNEQSRHRGIAKLLIEQVYASAQESGCSRIYWLTHESNHDAMRLYDKIAERTGFVHYKRSL